MTGNKNVVQHETMQAALRQDFLKWQCRLRELAILHAHGKPQSGMRPFVRLPGDEEPRARISTVIVKREPETVTKEFQHVVRRTVDPVERHNSALNKLGGDYYHDPAGFSDKLTALFGPRTSLWSELVERGECVLDFEQGGQQYSIPCTVERLSDTHPAYLATYWHNHMFNPDMPPGVIVLRFHPRWANAWAEPDPA